MFEPLAKPRLLVLGVVAIGMALAMAGWYAAGYRLLDLAAYLLMVIAIIAPVWRSDDNWQAFSATSYSVFLGLVTFALPALAIYTTRTEGTLLDRYSESCLLIAGAFAAYWFGYYGSFGVRLARSVPLIGFRVSRQFRAGPRLWVVTAVIYGVGWLGRLQLADLGFSHRPTDLGVASQFQSALGDLGAIATLCYVLLLYLTLKSQQSVWRKVLTCGLLFAFEIGAGLINGGRTAIAIPGLYLLLAYSAAIRPISLRTLILGYAIAFAILTPILTVYRGSYLGLIDLGDQPGFASSFTAMGGTFEEVSGGQIDLGQILERNLLASRSSTIRSTLRVLDRVPERYDFQWGATFVPDLLALPIPRVFFPDKPFFRATREFAIRFWDLAGGSTSVGIGMPAEAYYNFGWYGLLLFPLLGIVMRFLWERYRFYQNMETTHIVRLFFILFLVAGLSASFFSHFAVYIRQGLLYLGVMVLLNLQLPLRLDKAQPRRGTNSAGRVREDTVWPVA